MKLKINSKKKKKEKKQKSTNKEKTGESTNHDLLHFNNKKTGFSN